MLTLKARLILGTCLALAPALPLAAETLALASHVTAVTVYPQAAQVTREVSFTAAAAGTFDLVIADLPPDTVPQGMRFASDAALTIGAFALRDARVPSAVESESPAVIAARAALDAADEALRQAVEARDRILAKAEAAEAQVAFLGGIRIDGATLTPEALTALAQAVGTQVLAARQAALSARAEAAPAEKAVDAAQEARDKAQADLDALDAAPPDRMALSLSVTLDTAGPVTLDITHFVEDASWRPAYELALDDRARPARLTLDRGALVSQHTGEDWAGVALTLSTARPADQAAPSTLYPQQRWITDPQDRPALEKAEGAADMAFAEPAPVMAAAPAMSTAGADFSGIAVAYHLPQPVSVATDVEDLHLALDRLTFAPRVVAEAVPSRDATAFVVAAWVNDSPEILLPGDLTVSRDGTLVGGGALPLLAPGDKTRTGFGAIDGLKLTRTVPDASEGDHGVFTTSTERHETAVLKVENLTDQSWAVRLLDQVPYSEQDDLKIDYSADPMPDEIDIDGGRGLLGWNFELPAGQARAVTLVTNLSWPAGKVLQ